MAWKQMIFNGISSVLIWFTEGVGRAEADFASAFCAQISHVLYSSKGLAEQ